MSIYTVDIIIHLHGHTIEIRYIMTYGEKLFIVNLMMVLYFQYKGNSLDYNTIPIEYRVNKIYISFKGTYN